MHLPGPLRAVVGLVATAADEAKHLPDRAIELPMLVVSTALQASLRAQQRYARLTARGDEVLTRRAVSDEAPEWATFDEPLSGEELRRTMFATAVEGADGTADPEAVSLAESMVGSLFAVSDPHPAADDAPGGSDPGFAAARRDEAERRTVAAKKTTSARKATGRTRASGAATPAAGETAAKAPARKTAKAAAKKTVARKSAAEAATDTAAPSAKTVHKPRHTTPSAFDDVDDD